MARSGSGFLRCSDGEVRWGLFGAAGVLFRWRETDGSWRYLLQLRGAMTHQGDTWGVVGGALDEGEDPTAGALREAAEELGPIPEVQVEGTFVDRVADDWTYTTVICTVREPFAAETTHWETGDARWLTADEIAALDLHPAFAAAWPRILERLANLDVDDVNRG